MQEFAGLPAVAAAMQLEKQYWFQGMRIEHLDREKSWAELTLIKECATDRDLNRVNVLLRAHHSYWQSYDLDLKRLAETIAYCRAGNLIYLRAVQSILNSRGLRLPIPSIDLTQEELLAWHKQARAQGHPPIMITVHAKEGVL